MIVKNEANVISEALTSSIPLIDSFCIIDTGSEDNTISRIIDWSKDSKIFGLVEERDWKNFGHNRSEALDLAVADGKATHILFLDADDRFVIEGNFSREQIISGQSYNLRNKSSNIEYLLPGLIAVHGQHWEWKGVLHEYLTSVGQNVNFIKLKNVTVAKNIAIGGRSIGLSQKEKYMKDADVFLEFLKSNPEDPRSTYYLAQSYRDAGEHELALVSYQNRIGLLGWDQETYDAMLQAGLCLERLGRMAEALLQFQKAWSFRPSRRDAIYHCIRIFRVLGQYKLAQYYADLAYSIDANSNDSLFIDKGASSWKLDDEVSVSAYWMGDYYCSLDLALRALETISIPPESVKRIKKNALFARDKLLERARQPKIIPHQFASMKISTQITKADITLTITSCKRPDLFRRTIKSFLNSCLDADKINRWICVDDGTQDEELMKLREEFPFIEFHTEADKVGSGHVSSLNYIFSILSGDYWVHLEDDWEFFHQDSYLERAIDVFDTDVNVSQVLFNRNYGEDIADFDLVGGLLQTDNYGREYWLHEHIKYNSQKYIDFFENHPEGTISNVWWPHFSLRPSVLKVDQLKLLGPFKEMEPKFELEFAHRFEAMGFKSAFLYRLACIHIGKKVRDGNIFEKNAYDLKGTTR